MMKKDVFYKSKVSLKNSGKVLSNVLIIAGSFYFGYISNDWLFWGIPLGVNLLFVIGNLISLFSTVHFHSDHVSFYDSIGIPRHIAYDKIIGIYDTPNPAFILMMVANSGTVRIQYKSKNGRLLESSITMKDYDAVYCELSSRCPNVPFVSTEYENPLYTKDHQHNPKRTTQVFWGLIAFFVLLIGGLIYWAIEQHDNEAFTVPICMSLISTAFVVIFYKRMKKIDTLINKKK